MIMSYRRQDVKYETRSFWVLDVGAKGFQVLRSGGSSRTGVEVKTTRAILIRQIMRMLGGWS